MQNLLVGGSIPRMFGAVLAPVLLTTVAAGESLAPLLIGLNRASRLNWNRNARLDLVRKAIPPALAGAAEIVLLWLPGPDLRLRFYFVAFLIAIPLFTFFVVKLMRGRFVGGEDDFEGSQFIQFRTGGAFYEFDINFVLVPIAAAMLVIAVYLY